MAFTVSHTFRTRNIYVYLLFFSGTAHSLLSSYSSVWQTERNVRTVNTQGALSLIRYNRSKLHETYGPQERCLWFVNALTVRTDRRSKLRPESVWVYWTCATVSCRTSDFIFHLKKLVVVQCQAFVFWCNLASHRVSRLPSSVGVSPLNVSQFTLNLTGHSDQQAVAYVLEGLQHGFRLGFHLLPDSRLPRKINRLHFTIPRSLMITWPTRWLDVGL